MPSLMPRRDHFAATVGPFFFIGYSVTGSGSGFSPWSVTKNGACAWEVTATAG